MGKKKEEQTKEVYIKEYSAVGNMLYVMKGTFKAQKSIAIFLLVDILAVSFAAYLPSFLIKSVIADVEGKVQLSTLVMTILIWSSILLVAKCLSTFTSYNINWRLIVCRFSFMFKRVRKVLDMDFEYLESPKIRDLVHKAERVTGGNVDGIEGMMHSFHNVMITLVKIIIAMGILITLNPWLILLILGFGVCIYFNMDITKRNDKKLSWDPSTPYWRKQYYMETTTTNFSYGKDIRLFSMKDWLLKKYEGIHTQMHEYMVGSRNRWRTSWIINAFITLVEEVVTYTYLIYQVLYNNMSIDNFVFYFGSLTTFFITMYSIFNHITDMRKQSREVNDFRSFLEFQEADADQVKRPVPKADRYEFTFDHVSFCYPETDKMVLKDVSIKLVPGCRAVLESLRGTINMSREKQHDSFEKLISRLIAEKCMSLDFECTEDPKVLDQVEKAKEGMSWYSGGIGGIADQTANILMHVLSMTGVIVILFTGVPSLLILYAISVVIDRFFTKMINKIEVQMFMEMSKLNRIFYYIFWELNDIKFGKDIRLYGAEDMMERKARYFSDDIARTWRKQSRLILPYQEGTTVLSVIRSVIALILIGAKALAGKITIGELSKYYEAGNTMHTSLQGIVTGSQELMKRCNYAYEFVEFMKFPNAQSHGTKSIEGKGMHQIEFRNVTFAYPRSETTILKNINVTLTPGEHISIVGLNGAGKTTFIKLLCRLYDPTEGSILLDGVDIREYAYEEYVKLIAVVFQDFQLFAFTAYENVVLETKDSTDNSHTNAKLVHIIDEAGLSETIQELPEQLDTNIFKAFDEGGVELSGGQQQKLAIARALYKDAPIVILDEPTAALDPIAEYEIYKKFNTLVDQKTAIYISHRLSSCQFCDIIHVFDNGQIVETGTHEQLVKLTKGLYAKMFEAQAQYYRN